VLFFYIFPSEERLCRDERDRHASDNERLSK
jgi:hypothetical protein